MKHKYLHCHRILSLCKVLSVEQSPIITDMWSWIWYPVLAWRLFGTIPVFIIVIIVTTIIIVIITFELRNMSSWNVC